MAKFSCVTKDCPNNGITYETLDDGGFMECGACSGIVEASTNE